MKFEQRPDGLWLVFDLGEEAGPFTDLANAEAFLDWKDSQQ